MTHSRRYTTRNETNQQFLVIHLSYFINSTDLVLLWYQHFGLGGPPLERETASHISQRYISFSNRYSMKTWRRIRWSIIRMGCIRRCWGSASSYAAITSTKAKCSWRARPASAACALIRVPRKTLPIQMLSIIPNSDLLRVGLSLLSIPVFVAAKTLYCFTTLFLHIYGLLTVLWLVFQIASNRWWT